MTAVSRSYIFDLWAVVIHRVLAMLLNVRRSIGVRLENVTSAFFFGHYL
jgi:hypothetical protein